MVGKHRNMNKTKTYKQKKRKKENVKEDAFSEGYLIIHRVATSDMMKGYFQSRHQLIYTTNNKFFSFPETRRRCNRKESHLWTHRHFQNRLEWSWRAVLETKKLILSSQHTTIYWNFKLEGHIRPYHIWLEWI